ncbi:hypothetical protein ZWY2020_036971 [Hordeum vulgare]|nr:hypothetical protein ZWY2020_036971 [Hordeum vulgare]
MGAAHDDGDFAATPAATPAPAPARGGGGVFQVAGLPVEFPYKPYGTQLAFMGRVIATLDRGRRQGRSHALLESPTGTGKSLSLLCAALAWQRHSPAPRPPRPPPLTPSSTAAASSPTTPSSSSSSPLPKAAAAAKKKKAPTIYYATRTHSQITQVVRELRKTPYRVRMAILASRKHYCVNKSACMTDSVDEECKRLLDDKVHGCLEFKNAQKLSRHPSLQTGGSYEVHDIEDLLKVGRQVKGCPYFAAQTMAEAAQLVFCPYNYLISPIVRRAMDINIAGSIVILDEAHNIEDIARDSGSVDVDEESLNSLAEELAKLATDQAVGKIYQPLHDIIQGLSNWIAAQEGDPRDNEFGRPASLNPESRITPAYFPILQEFKAASDTESEGDHLTGRGSVTLESLFSSLSHFFGRNGRHLYDYQLAIQRLAHREGTSAFGVRNVMSLWCLNPAVVFQDIADITHSVILTSGTLSPMGSFASELVFASVLSSGPTTHRLNASYKSADAYSFQDELGASIEEICRIVPGGALVFFPSYKLLDKLKVRWSQTGQWARLNAQKPVFVEPRGSTEELEPVLNGYYNAILGKVPLKKGRGGANQIVKNRVRKNSSQESAKGGAAFLAVCRGKVSEGIDFSDDNARVVVIVGIPFPNVNDVQVKLKKKYNDSYKSSKNLLSGSEWYCHQAFRALNQAAGRCIRHKLDYGGIILIDERYQEERNLLHISKWLKNSIKHYGSFQETMDKLEKFFQKAEEHIKIKRQEMSTKDKLDDDLLISCVDKRKLPCPESNFSKNPVLQSNQKGKLDDDLLTSHGDTRKRPWPEPYLSKHSVLQSNQKVKNKRGSLKVSNIDVAGLDRKNYGMPYTSSGACQKESSPAGKSFNSMPTPPSHNIQSNLEDEADIWGNHEVDINVTDLNNCDSMPGHVKLTIFTPPEGRSQEPTLVEGTSTEDPFVSPSDCSEVNTSAAMYNDEDQVVGMSASASTANRNQSCVSTSAGTPETTANRGYHLDHESSVNRSVNSQYQKRRRFNIPMSCCTGTEHSNPSLNPSNPSLDPSNPASTSLCNTDCAVSMVTGDLKRTDGQCCKSMEMSRCENFKLERSHKPVEFASNKSAGTKLDIRCTRCKTPLGLQKDGFLVSSSLASPSKFYLTYLFRNGISTVGFTENLMASPPAVLNVIVCDASSLNQELLSKFCIKVLLISLVFGLRRMDVYKAVTCPFCCRENSFAMVLERSSCS